MSEYRIDFDALDGVTRSAPQQKTATPKKTRSVKRAAVRVVAPSTPTLSAVPKTRAVREAPPLPPVPPPPASSVQKAAGAAVARKVIPVAAPSPVQDLEPVTPSPTHELAPVSIASAPTPELAPLEAAPASADDAPAAVTLAAGYAPQEPDTSPIVLASASPPDEESPRRWLLGGALVAVAAVAALGLAAWVGAGTISGGSGASATVGGQVERRVEGAALEETAEVAERGSEPIAAIEPAVREASPTSAIEEIAEVEEVEEAPVEPAPIAVLEQGTALPGETSASGATHPTVEAVDAQPAAQSLESEHVVMRFPVDAAYVPPRIVRDLRALVPRLSRCEAGVVVTGYTDDTGSDRANVRVSERRARSVSDALADAGLDPAQIHRVPGGSRHPIADNRTAEGRLQNRRATVACR